MNSLALGLAGLSLFIWIFLLLGWGQFWRADQRLVGRDEKTPSDSSLPSVCAVIPARNEADMIPTTLRSLLQQDYAGEFSAILTDDCSTDGTGDLAKQIAAEEGMSEQFEVLSGQPLPAGWSGKLWAMEQGIRHALARPTPPDYFLLTDADIVHAPENLRQLAFKGGNEDLDLVSLMVRLRCESFWEQALIPAFIFFFQKLYPFRWANSPQRKMAAAAGGCILIRRKALERIGGIGAIREALIDDCALAAKVKAGGKIWLGLSETTYSLRPYDSLESIWNMVARTAYTQLHYSPLLLAGTLLGMVLTYLVAPIGTIAGLLTGNLAIAGLCALTWGLMALSYWPTVRLYRQSPLWTVVLPAIASIYTVATFDSAWRHWQGKGGAWKGRTYSATD